MSVRSFTDLVDAFVVCDGTGKLGGVGLISGGGGGGVMAVGVGGCIPCHGGCNRSVLCVCVCVEGRACPRLEFSLEYAQLSLHSYSYSYSLQLMYHVHVSCITVIDWCGVWFVA